MRVSACGETLFGCLAHCDHVTPREEVVFRQVTLTEEIGLREQQLIELIAALTSATLWGVGVALVAAGD